MEDNFLKFNSNNFLIIFVSIIVGIIVISGILGNFNIIVWPIACIIFTVGFIFKNIKWWFMEIMGYETSSIIKNANEAIVTPIVETVAETKKGFFHYFSISEMDPQTRKQLGTYMFLSYFLYLISFGLAVYVIYNFEVISVNLYYYLPLILIPLVLGIYMSYQIQTNEGVISTIPFTALVFITIILFSYCYSLEMNPFEMLMSLTIKHYIFWTIIIIGLAIVFMIFGDSLKRQTGWVGFIINLIFFIPCLVGDFIHYINNQFSVTPNIVFVLLITEMVLILAYIFLPLIFSKYIHKNAVVLLDKPVYLSHPTVIADSNFFTMKHNNIPVILNSNYRNNNYAFSMWILMDTNMGVIANKEGEHEEPIFCYGNSPDGKTGRPLISYINSDNNRNNIYRVYVSDNPQCYGSSASVANNNGCYVEITSLPVQKWNFFVFNYSGDRCDVFVNGELNGTIKIDETQNVPNDGTDTDNVVVGNSSGLLSGAIRNVDYHTVPLSLFQIINMYNLFAP